MGIPLAAVGYGGKKLGESQKKNAPAPPDYMGLANQQAGMQQNLLNQQTAANRPNQSSPFASSQWSKGPDGQWTQQLGFTGPLAGASQNVQQQLLQAMTGPLDFSGLPQVGTGEAARDQAINAAYGQATSRLDPRFSRARDAERTRLLNQGLSEGSEAYNRAMGELGNQETDAYNQAMFSAIGQGGEAGERIFRQGMMGRNQGIEEMLRQRNQPMTDAQNMQSLLGMPSFAQAGMGEAPNLVGAGAMSDAANFRDWQQKQQMMADYYGGAMDLFGQGMSMAPYFLSDERAKTDVERLPYQVVPGVPGVAFRYRPEVGLGTGRHVGVSAQDLQRAFPGAVRPRPDGLLEVHPAFAPFPVE